MQPFIKQVRKNTNRAFGAQRRTCTNQRAQPRNDANTSRRGDIRAGARRVQENPSWLGRAAADERLGEDTAARRFRVRNITLIRWAPQAPSPAHAAPTDSGEPEPENPGFAKQYLAASSEQGREEHAAKIEREIEETLENASPAEGAGMEMGLWNNSHRDESRGLEARRLSRRKNCKPQYA